MSPTSVKNLKQKIFLLIFIWLILSGLSYLAVFKTLKIYHLSHTIPMVFLTFFVFLFSIYIILKLFEFPRQNKAICILFVISIGYIGILTVFAALRIYYSRQFMLFSFIVSYISLYGILGISSKKVRKKYALLYSDNSIREQEIMAHGIDLVSSLNDINDPFESFDGIVLKDFSFINDPETARIITREIFRGAKLFSFAELYASLTGKIPLEMFKPELIKPKETSILYPALKSLFERLVCIIFFLPAAILGLIVSLFIVLDDGLPVFFSQERVGFKGRPFRLIKFRTMKKDAELNGPAFANNNDHRITRIGRIIRKLRLDELPQIINIIKGEMSLIGPRPEQVPFAREFEKTIPFYSLRYNILPGLTGWAQIHSGYAANLDQTKEKLEYDLYYLFNQSLLLDLVIIFKTIKIIFTGHGAL